ncbi:MAG: hypothetical protein ABIE23_05615 [archaeon]
MGVKKAIGIIIILIIIGVIGYYLLEGRLPFLGYSFDNGLAKIDGIDSSYGLNEERIVPGEEDELKGYLSELIEFRKELNELPSSNEVKALGLLVDARINLVGMKEALIEAKKETELSHGEGCERGTPTYNAINAFEEAEDYASKANSSIKELEEDYPMLAEKTREWNENVLVSTTEISERTEELALMLQQYC